MALDGLKKFFGSLLGGATGGGNDRGSISCDEARAKLFEYLDGELSDATREEVQRHLDVCTACYPRLQFERHFLDALHTAERRGGASQELKNRVLQALADEGAGGVS